MSSVVEAPSALGLPPGFEVRFAGTPEEFTAIVELRRRVFLHEQAIVDGQVTDAEDARAIHVLAVVADGAIGTGRLAPPTIARPQAHIAWVATLPGFRGRGVGTAIMRALLAAADDADMAVVTLSAQTHALAFYRRLGFVPYGDRFVVRGIEHQQMARHRPG
jgi:predicted GNAT family N-acyltransferase